MYNFCCKGPSLSWCFDEAIVNCCSCNSYNKVDDLLKCVGIVLKQTELIEYI